MHQSPANGSAADAMHAVSRLLAAALDAPNAAVVERALVREARQLFGVSTVVLLTVDPREHLARVVAVDADENLRAVRPSVFDVPVLNSQRLPSSELRGQQLDSLSQMLGLRVPLGFALALPLRSRDVTDHLLILADADLARAVREERAELAAAFAAAAASGLAQLRLVEAQTAQTAQQAALARAARILNETLEEPAVLDAICREARSILGGDSAAAYIADRDGTLVIESAMGLGEEYIGRRMARGEGISGRVALSDRAILTNDYQRIAAPAADSPFTDVQACLAVPMHWDGELRGVLSIGFTRPHFVSAQDLALLEAFGEIAAAACRNASATAGLERAARTDGLTGCLNHAALQEALSREAGRTTRTGQDLSVILLDLDDFKQVNEREGHLVGDEVLRRVGQALRLATRPYDVVARYGGDEFAIIAVGADEDSAHEIAERAIEEVRDAMGGFERPLEVIMTAGLVTSTGAAEGAGLLEAADRALLHGKHHGGRGQAIRASQVPDRLPVSTIAVGRRLTAPPAPVPLVSSREPESREERSNPPAHDARRLLMAGALGARIAALVDQEAIAEAVVDELHRQFGYYLCAVVRLREDDQVHAVATRGGSFQRLGATRWSQPRELGIIGRALAENRVILSNDVRADTTFVGTGETGETRAELVAPIWVGDHLWGVINIEEARTDAFDDEDARLLATVAHQAGSALRSAELYAQLERAYLGTATALATALEAKDSYTAAHATSIVGWVREVGARLGMTSRALRTLHYGAIFHDIGKIAVPESVLNKRGPLNEEEWALMRRHTIVGEQILAPVEFLADVLPIVRHEHENWDGSGYPDGLQGEAIPLGARIVLACDAYHAMTSDRPYRQALTHEEALAELDENAGRQFDPEVVRTLASVLEERGDHLDQM